MEEIRSRFATARHMVDDQLGVYTSQQKIMALVNVLGDMEHLLTQNDLLAREQVDVVVDNTESSIATWLETVAKAQEDEIKRRELPGWSSENARPDHYRDVARAVRQGEWRS